MTNNPNIYSIQHKSPQIQLLVAFLIIMAAGTFLFSLFLYAGKIIFNSDLSLLESPDLLNDTGGIAFLKYTLICQDISFFIVPAILIMLILNPQPHFEILNVKVLRVKELFLVLILTICAIPVTGFTGEINSSITLPDWLSGVETWIKAREDYASDLIGMIMSRGSFSAMLLNIIVISLLPALGEELIFRGVFQHIFQKMFRSGHLAVWITSIIFSAIHLQFYGFLPRFILGLIFGYLFLWSKNLWFPFLAHFVNNAVPTVGAYLEGWDKINASSTGPLWKQLTGLIIPLAAGIMILEYFRRRAVQEDIPGQNDCTGISKDY